MLIRLNDFCIKLVFAYFLHCAIANFIRGWNFPWYDTDQKGYSKIKVNSCLFIIIIIQEYIFPVSYYLGYIKWNQNDIHINNFRLLKITIISYFVFWTLVLTTHFYNAYHIEVSNYLLKFAWVYFCSLI